MKKWSKVWIVFCVLTVGSIFPMQAQFLKNLKKAVENVGKEVDKVMGNSSDVNSSQSNEGNAVQQEVKEQNLELEGLPCGNFGTDVAKETCVSFHETASTKK